MYFFIIKNSQPSYKKSFKVSLYCYFFQDKLKFIIRVILYLIEAKNVDWNIVITPFVGGAKTC